MTPIAEEARAETRRQSIKLARGRACLAIAAALARRCATVTTGRIAIFPPRCENRLVTASSSRKV
jgi:hypothetical protein